MDAREILAEKVRAIMSPKRRHKERDLYDMHVLFGKGIGLLKSDAMAKLEDSKVAYSERGLLDSIDAIKKTWTQLDPFIPGPLLQYKDARDTVIMGLKKAGLL